MAPAKVAASARWYELLQVLGARPKATGMSFEGTMLVITLTLEGHGILHGLLSGKQ